MSHNIFGNLLTFSTWGESHGEAIGCVVDGYPANIDIDLSFIQSRLNLRRPDNQNLPLKETKRMKSGFYLAFLMGSLLAPLSRLLFITQTREAKITQV